MSKVTHRCLQDAGDSLAHLQPRVMPRVVRRPPRSRLARCRAGLLFLAASVSACSAADADRSLTPGVPPADAALAEVRQLISLAVCTTDADCRTIAIGSKACGGPEAYLAWSVRQTDPQALSAAAARHADQQRTQNQKPGGRMSNCAWVSDPGAQCVAAAGDAPRHCVLRSTRGGGGAGTQAY